MKWREDRLGCTTIDEHNEALISRWNSVVGDSDITLVLGDFVMGKKLETLPVIERLNGRKILLTGNHDGCWHYARYGDNEKTARKIAIWRQRYEDVGIDILNNSVYYDWQFGDVPVTICHFPAYGDHTEEERYTHCRPIDNGQPLIHGHIHNAWLVNGGQVNIGVDRHNFTPWAEDELVAFLKAERLA